MTKSDSVSGAHLLERPSLGAFVETKLVSPHFFAARLLQTIDSARWTLENAVQFK
jgi:hypothetical protein